MKSATVPPILPSRGSPWLEARDCSAPLRRSLETERFRDRGQYGALFVDPGGEFGRAAARRMSGLAAFMV
jgi:hypothetical protein